MSYFSFPSYDTADHDQLGDADHVDQGPSLRDDDPSLDDALFLERLKFFYEQSLTDIRAFAQREGRPYEEVSLYLWTRRCWGKIRDTNLQYLSYYLTGPNSHSRVALRSPLQPLWREREAQSHRYALPSRVPHLPPNRIIN